MRNCSVISLHFSNCSTHNLVVLHRSVTLWPSGPNLVLAPIREEHPSQVEFFLNDMEMNDSMATVFTFIHNYTAMQYNATRVHVTSLTTTLLYCLFKDTCD